MNQLDLYTLIERSLKYRIASDKYNDLYVIFQITENHTVCYLWPHMYVMEVLKCGCKSKRRLGDSGDPGEAGD